MRRCAYMRMWRDEEVRMWSCEDVRMWRWSDVKRSRCQDVRCEGVKMSGCQDAKLRSCEDDRRWRWEDKQMWRCKDGWQTPTIRIRITLRSDAFRIKKRFCFCQLQTLFLNSLCHCWLQTPALLVARLDRKILLEQPICGRSCEPNVGCQSSARHASRGSNNKRKTRWSQTGHVQNLLQTCLCPNC